MASNTTSILFICMGNICRSPAAEAVFLAKTDKLGIGSRFDVDGAGTGGWHVGNSADQRSSAEGSKRGYALTTKARQVNNNDWAHFDLLIVMDEDNRQELLSMGAPDEKINLLSDWHPDKSIYEVPDPYYGGDHGFVYMYDLIELSIDGLIKSLITDNSVAHPGHTPRSLL